MPDWKLLDPVRLEPSLELIAEKLRSKSTLTTKYVFPDGYLHALDRLKTNNQKKEKIHILQDQSGNNYDLYQKEGVDNFNYGIDTKGFLPAGWTTNSEQYRDIIDYDILWSATKRLTVLPKTIEAAIWLPTEKQNDQ